MMYKTNISYNQLHEVLHYNKLTGIFIWKINILRIKKGTVAGYKDNNGYIQITINDEAYLAHRLAWLYDKGYLPEHDLDHKDRIRHHNWILNLRESSRSCNMKNTDNQKNNTSGIKGVSFYKLTQKWVVHINVNGSMKFLGYYKNFDNAVCARFAGEQCINWETCDSSSPASQYVQTNIFKNNNAA